MQKPLLESTKKGEKERIVSPIMSWLSEIKDKAREHVITSILGLSALLLGVIWAAVPAKIWGRVSAATPKPVLWATCSLLGLGLIVESACLVRLHREAKAKLKPRFGVLWSRDLEPHCPACSKPFGRYAEWVELGSPEWGFWCAEHKEIFSMSDDNGHILELRDAKELLRKMPF